MVRIFNSHAGRFDKGLLFLNIFKAWIKFGIARGLHLSLFRMFSIVGKGKLILIEENLSTLNIHTKIFQMPTFLIVDTILLVTKKSQYKS